MTMRTPNRLLRPTDLLDISPDGRGAPGFADGDRVRVRSRYGAATLPLHVDDAPRAGEVFATFTDPTIRVNLVTGPWRDACTDTPEYKGTAVRLEKLQPAGREA